MTSESVMFADSHVCVTKTMPGLNRGMSKCKWGTLSPRLLALKNMQEKSEKRETCLFFSLGCADASSFRHFDEFVTLDRVDPIRNVPFG